MKTQSVRSSSCVVVGCCHERDGGMKSRLARAIIVCMRCILEVGSGMNDCTKVRVS